MLESIAENRGYNDVSPYIRNLIQQDIQEQISEGELELVPTHD